ncbi:hypothetical protein [Frankia sp. CiP3]|uniref:hypothetical protein n=1 Tax=Frankia sp. CiP3 TaxID=2880971 RepID=UPI001EF3EF4B|nr:hypothetical protein [Frankia sp. CiP3]
MADRVTELFNNELAGVGSTLLSIDLNGARFSNLAALGYDYLARPMFVGKTEMDRFIDDTNRAADLIFSLPERLFHGDFDRFHDALRLSPARARLMRRIGVVKPPRFGRIDAYHDGASLKILEFNVGSDCGGQDWVGAVPRALLDIAAFRSFAEQHELTYIDTGGLVAELLRQAGSTVTGGRDPVVAMVGEPGDLAVGPGPWQPFQTLLRDAGLETHFCGITDLRLRNGRVLFGDIPVDLLYRLFVADHIVDDPAAVEITEQVMTAHAEGRVVFWTSLETEAFRNKSCMAFLSDPRLRTWLRDDERQLIDRLLPWTRSLLGEAALEDRELVERCRDSRENLILKPNGLYGGRGITAGWEVDDDEWWQVVQAGAAAGAVLQERVLPRREPVVNPATGQVESWEACWGLYYTPDGGYAGGGCRFLPFGKATISDVAPAGRPPGSSIFESSRAGIFLYPDGSDAGGSDAGSRGAARASSW